MATAATTLDPTVQAALTEAIAAAAKEPAADQLKTLIYKLSAKAGCTALPPPTSDFLSTIGNTPMVKLGKMLPAGCKAKAVYVKLEMQNPGGSIKDRIAKNMLEEAEASGKLKPGTRAPRATPGLGWRWLAPPRATSASS